MSLTIGGFYSFRPKLPYLFDVKIFTGENETYTYTVQSVKMPAMDAADGDACTFLGDEIIYTPLFNPASRTIEITFEETDDMDVTKVLTLIQKFQYRGINFNIGILITDYQKKFFSASGITQYRSRFFACRLKSFDLPQFNNGGSANICTLNASFIVMAELPADQADRIRLGVVNLHDAHGLNGNGSANKMSAPEKNKTNLASLGMSQDQLSKVVGRNNGNGGGELRTTKNGKEIPDFNIAETSKIGNVKWLDITKSSSGNSGFNALGQGVKASNQNFSVVIHRVGFNSKGAYSDQGAAIGFNGDGVAAFLSGNTRIASLDRLYANHSSAAGHGGSTTGGLAIELGDATLIGNAGAVVKVNDKYYINVETGKGAEWVEASQQQLNDFAAAVGVSNISDAFVAADGSDKGVSAFGNGKHQVDGAGSVDFTGGTVLVPKLTKVQQTNLEEYGKALGAKAKEDGVTFDFSSVYHHGNVPGYSQLKIEGTIALDKQALELIQKGYKAGYEAATPKAAAPAAPAST